MIQKDNIFFDFENFNILANNFSKQLKIGSVVFLKGDLGAGKTTFARMVINSLYDLNNIVKPNSIKSPSFPILLTYDLGDFEIFHYDLYRINSLAELSELNIEENLAQSITLVEWPEIILSNKVNYSFHLIEFMIHNETTRSVDIKFTN